MSLGTVASQHKRNSSSGARQKKTLVVDDSETILHAICALLEHHEIVEVAGRAESGPQAIDAVIELKPDLVLMDADMPGMSGLRTALLLSQWRHDGHPDVDGHKPAISGGVRRMRRQCCDLQTQIFAGTQRLAAAAFACTSPR